GRRPGRTAGRRGGADRDRRARCRRRTRMSGARVIFVRHAEPHEDMRGRIYGRTDVELSVRGFAHAEEIAARLKVEPIVAVYASPLRRAVETARPLASSLGLEPIV